MGLLPLLRYQMRHAHHLASLRPEMDTIYAATMKKFKNHTRSDQIMHFSKEIRALLKREKCNPLKSIAITVAQIPLFITMVLSVRQMVNSGRYAEMKEGVLAPL